MKSVNALVKAKRQRRVTMVTCYDYWSAKILSASQVDMVLVGDSLAMVMHGFENTLHADNQMMAVHTAAVARGIQDEKLIVTDFPFLEFRKSTDFVLSAAQRFLQAGANVLKVEGAKGNLEKIHFLTESGVPVMGHLGLTPQMINAIGGYKVQGKTEAAADEIVQDAIALEQAGCIALVLECVPAHLAASVTERLKIPVIGIGAGQHVDGQVLVLHDLLGVDLGVSPRFVRKYEDLNQILLAAVNEYCEDVKTLCFPAERESYL